jgi:hypothetical protein
MGKTRDWSSVSLALAVAALLTWPAAGARAAQGALDGRTFVGETGEKGKPKGEADELVFLNGTFRSKGCDQYGFAAAPYTARAAAGGTSFVADARSAKEGAMHWTGTVKGELLEGTAVWTKPGQAAISYWVKGKLKK